MSSFLQDAINSALQARREHEARLMNMDNVVATGVGFKIAGTTQTTEPSVIVSVTKKLPLDQISAAALVPKTVNNVKTDVIETGKLVAFQDPTQKMRPAQPGVSLGHYQITAGTFGCLVQRGGQIYILSNNHVLANVNDAQIGDPIWQPGKYDSGTSADQIATLEQFFFDRFRRRANSNAAAQRSTGLRAFRRAAQCVRAESRRSACAKSSRQQHDRLRDCQTLESRYCLRRHFEHRPADRHRQCHLGAGRAEERPHHRLFDGADHSDRCNRRR